MIPKECKRLAEVDFPIAVVSKHSAREKSIRHGHPSTLHLWWARRPLAACRAMLMALLLPDPCDPQCPEEFKSRARNILPGVQGKPGPKDIDLRNELVRFIGDFANWDNSTNATYVEAARGLVRAAHGEEPPLVVDPFAGGGSIPLEALRLGCDAFASDLNPVACLILKTMLEDIPRRGPTLADDLRRVGAEIKAAAEKKLSEFYPAEPDGSTPIAYLWARTITCDSCGAEIPLVRSLWLSSKSRNKRALRFHIERSKGRAPEVLVDVFEPERDSDVQAGTCRRAKATCPACKITSSPDRVRAQLTARRGGADVEFDTEGNRVGGARLLAVVTAHETRSGRQYRATKSQDYRPLWLAMRRLKVIGDGKLSGGLSAVPDEPLRRVPVSFGVINLWVYGMSSWGDLFGARQKLALSTFAQTLREEHEKALCLTISKLADFNSAVSRWAPGRETSAATFGRPALGMVWDYCETNPTGTSTGSFNGALEYLCACVEQSLNAPGQVEQADAAKHPLPDQSALVWFTDPPYYDSVPYSYISDFFYVWLKRAGEMRNARADELTPKQNEIVAYMGDDKSQESAYARYESQMARAFAEGRRVLRPDGIGSVVFAHKTTAGWEALLSGMVRGGWTITGSWPIVTERSVRPRAQESAALSASVHLVCRPRPDDAPIGDWGDVLRELPHRVGDWIERLQAEGIKGADLVFACIGPAMEIYSRYRHVEDAEGREIPLGGDPTATEPYKRGFLAYVWETVGRLALEEVLGTAEAKARNGAAGALEEDSRLTALFLWTLQTTNGAISDQQSAASKQGGERDESEAEDDDEEGVKPKKKKAGYTLIFDVARRFAQPLGIHLDKWEGRIIETEKGIVRLLPVVERAEQLFGETDAAAFSRRIEEDVKASRNLSFAFMQDSGAVPEIKSRGKRGAKRQTGNGAEPPMPQPATTLDRLHAAMLLQRSGQTNGLRALLKDEMQRGPDFLRLANALSRLYPKDSDEKRLLDAMLLAIPKN